MLIGLVLGPFGLNWLDHASIESAGAIVDFAVGLVLFELGQRLDLRWLRRDPWLAVTGLAESGLSFLCMYGVLIWFGIEPLFAAFAAAIGMATSPAVVLLVAKEMKAEGQVTERALCLTALNGVLAFTTLTLLTALSTSSIRRASGGSRATDLRAAGVVAARLSCRTNRDSGARVLGKREGTAVRDARRPARAGCRPRRCAQASVLVALLTFGILARNLDRNRWLMSINTGYAGQIFYVVLFVFLGAALRPDQFATGGLVAILFVLSRFVGKSLGVMLFAPLSRLRPGSAGLLSLALVPMSGLALMLAQGPGNLYPEFGAKLSAVVLAAAVILELIGPLAAQFALRRAGETEHVPEVRYGSPAI